MSTDMSSIEHFYRGKFIDRNVPQGDYGIIAYSKNLSLEYAQSVFKSVYVGSHSTGGGIHRYFQGYICTRHEDKYIFAEIKQSNIQDRGNYFPEYHVLVLPLEIYEKLQGNLIPLTEVFLRSGEYPKTPNMLGTLEPLSLNIVSASLESETKSLDIFRNKFDVLLNLVSMILSHEMISLVDVPLDIRFELVQALIFLLPPPARSAPTFATEVFEVANSKIGLQFQYYERRNNKQSYFWNELPIKLDSHKYTVLLQEQYKLGTRKLLEFIHSMSARLETIQRHDKEFNISQSLYILANSMLLEEQIRSGTANVEDIENAIIFDSLLPNVQKQKYFEVLVNTYLAENFNTLSLHLFDNPLLYQFLQDHLNIFAESAKNSQNILQSFEFWLKNRTDGHSSVQVLHIIKSLGSQFWIAIFPSQTDQENFFVLTWKYGLYEFSLEWLHYIELSSPLNEHWLQTIYKTVASNSTETDQIEPICLKLEENTISEQVSVSICTALLEQHGIEKSKALRKLITNLWLTGALSLELQQLVAIVKQQSDQKVKNIVFDRAVKVVANTELHPKKKFDLLNQLLTAFSRTEKETNWFLNATGLRHFSYEIQQSITLINAIQKYSESPAEVLEHQYKLLQKALKDLTAEELGFMSTEIDIFIVLLDSFNNSSRLKIFPRVSRTNSILDTFKKIQTFVTFEINFRQ